MATPTSTAGSRDPTVTGLFRDRDSAEKAYQALSDHGYGRDDVNVIMSDETRQKYFEDPGLPQTELGTKAAQGAGVGSAIGGGLGALIGALAAVGTSIAIPGAGIVLAGPIAAALAGAGAGGIAGGLVGALIGAGIPEERVTHYEEGIKQGGIVMGFKSRSEEDARRISEAWTKHRGQHVYY
jgi:hypothetical protein